MNDKQINELQERIQELLNKNYELNTFENELKEIEKDYHCKLRTRKVADMIVGVDIYVLK